MHTTIDEKAFLDDVEVANAVRMYARSMGLEITKYATVEIVNGAKGYTASVVINHSNRDVPKVPNI